MRHFTAIMALAAALTLTACSVPAITSGPAGAPSTTPALTAAPIPAQAAAAPSTTAASQYGDYTQDEFYLAGIRGAWRGTKPTDAEFVAAAHYACDQMDKGIDRADIRAAAGTGEDADWNNDHLTQYAAQIYCTDYAL